jgi:hypothetical protein
MNQGVSYSARVILRLVLYRGEVYRLPAAGRGVRVCEGEAWITLEGQDTFLARGEELHFVPKKDFAVVSAVGGVPLTLEILINTCPAPSSIRSPVFNPAASDC